MKYQQATLAVLMGGGPRVVVSTAAFHARVRESKMFLPHPLVKVSIVGTLRDREVMCSASDLQGLNFESCVWKAVSSHHPQEVLLAQFSLYVHKSGLKPDPFHFICCPHIETIRNYEHASHHVVKPLTDKKTIIIFNQDTHS